MPISRAARVRSAICFHIVFFDAIHAATAATIAAAFGSLHYFRCCFKVRRHGD